MTGRVGRGVAAWSLVLATVGCASSGYHPEPFPKAGPAPPPVSLDPPAEAAVRSRVPIALSLVEVARTLLGSPYRDGGSTPQGFDCSGFVQYVFTRVGWHMPRTVEAQVREGGTISRGDVQPGDLVFFRTTSRRATHVGIAVSATAFIHAPNERGVVKVDSFADGYWDRRFIQARRLVAAGR